MSPSTRAALGDRTGLLAHLRKPDHWTFLVGYAFVLANVRRGDRRLSALGAVFLGAALCYDCYEVLTDVE